jgi:hypothetical protein
MRGLHNLIDSGLFAGASCADGYDEIYGLVAVGEEIKHAECTGETYFFVGTGGAGECVEIRKHAGIGGMWIEAGFADEFGELVD